MQQTMAKNDDPPVDRFPSTSLTRVEAARALYPMLPYDLPFAVGRFLAHFRPLAGFLIETELWPNLIAQSSAAGIPLFLVNARLSERSARGYARFSSLTRPMLARLAGVAAQSQADS